MTNISRRDIDHLRSQLHTTGLARPAAEHLLNELDRLLYEREVIDRALARLGQAWPQVRAALNELQRSVRR